MYLRRRTSITDDAVPHFDRGFGERLILVSESRDEMTLVVEIDDDEAVFGKVFG